MLIPLFCALVVYLAYRLGCDPVPVVASEPLEHSDEHPHKRSHHKHPS